jgi:DNA-directed RNA polymerase sigma subunit (sigma70/sigma32)
MDEYDTRTATNNIDADSDTNDNLEVVRNMLSMLNDEQREIIERMYGIGTDVEESTDTIAMRMGITPNRVRRVANIAIKEMRKKSRNIAI